MNNVVHKYPLILGYNSVYTRAGAQFLSVGCQFNTQMVLWALVDTNAPMAPKQLYVLPTGQYSQYPLGRFLGTIAVLDGTEFYHVFEAV